jgi:hypothetical protein
MGWWFSKSINLQEGELGDYLNERSVTYRSQVFQRMQFWTQPAVNAKELLVHNCGERKAAERLHAGLVNLFGILVLAFQLEGEVVG